MLYFLLFGMTMLFLIIGSVVDLRIREVPDLITYSLVFLGIAVRGVFAVDEKNFSLITTPLIYLAAFFLLACLMYYTKQWGGGDSKLLIAMAVIFSTTPYNTLFPFPLIILINILLVGLIYSLIWAGVLIIKNRKKFMERWLYLLKEVKKQRIIAVIIGLALLIFQFFIPFISIRLLILALGIFTIISNFLWAGLKAIEDVCMIKKIPVRKLREGDWIIKDIILNRKKIYSSKSTGVTKEQIRMLQKSRLKYLMVKEGIAFAPSFLIGVVISLIIKNIILINLIS